LLPALDCAASLRRYGKGAVHSHAQSSGLCRRASAIAFGLLDRPNRMTPRLHPRDADMKVDVLSNVLAAIRLTGAVYFDFELTSPWVLEAPPSREIAETVMPGAQRVIEFHLVAHGSGWGHAVGQTPVRLHEGDVIAFPQGDAHVLCSTPGMRAAPDAKAFAGASTLPMIHERGGAGGARARILCCFLGCDERPFNPLLTALPAVIHLSADGPGAATDWPGTLLSMAATESRGNRAGRENVLARLSELMFVDTIRRHLETLPPAGKGWLAGLRDPVIGQALAALHRDPALPWTVERLARVVGVSRSVLAERFSLTLGQPPMQYLALWRMQLASRLLRDGRRVASVAGAVGYESEAAFSRVFKKLIGLPPAAWRRAN
jgi:AraC-like DNA-binding protein